jgi:predicted DNA-binding transcriptional regulator YafY
MRASRLLQILLMLQNRGRMTSGALARELEVARRTILRDVDALTEAGLPVIVHQGNQGGIELGFNYRTRLTGLAADEAEALGVILAQPIAELAALGIDKAADRARRKLIESFPDQVRERIALATRRFRFVVPEIAVDSPRDPRVPALAEAIRHSKIVRINAHRAAERTIHPVTLTYGPRGWCVEDGLSPNDPIRLDECGDINVSARTFRQHATAPRG